MKVIAHDEPKLANDDTDKEKCRHGLDGKDLDIELDEPEPRGPVKSLPRIHHADTAAATGDGRLDLAAERAVEGYNRLVFLGQQRSLHTGEGDFGGEDDGEDDEQPHQPADHELHHIAEADLRIDSLVMRRVLGIAVQAVDVEQGCGDVDRELIGGCPDGGGKQDFGGRLSVGETAPPFLRARVAHHDMCPRQVQPSKRGVSDDGEERTAHGRGEAPDEDVVEEGVDYMVHDRDLETTEAGPWTGLGAKVSHGGADLGGDGSGRDREELRLEFLDFLVMGDERGIAFIQRGGRVDGEVCCSGTLDGGESGYNRSKGVANLYVVCCQWAVRG